MNSRNSVLKPFPVKPSAKLKTVGDAMAATSAAVLFELTGSVVALATETWFVTDPDGSPEARLTVRSTALAAPAPSAWAAVQTTMSPSFAVAGVATEQFQADVLLLETKLIPLGRRSVTTGATASEGPALRTVMV